MGVESSSVALSERSPGRETSMDWARLFFAVSIASRDEKARLGKEMDDGEEVSCTDTMHRTNVIHPTIIIYVQTHILYACIINYM